MFRLHLQKEPVIFDQKTDRDFTWALDQIIGEVRSVLMHVPPKEAESFIQELEKANRIFCFGAGRSGFVPPYFLHAPHAIRLHRLLCGRNNHAADSTGRFAYCHLRFRRDRPYLWFG